GAYDAARVGIASAAVPGVGLRVDAAALAQHRAARTNEGAPADRTHLSGGAGAVASAAVPGVGLRVDAAALAQHGTARTDEGALAERAHLSGGAGAVASAAVRRIDGRVHAHRAAQGRAWSAGVRIAAVVVRGIAVGSVRAGIDGCGVERVRLR